jgi:hypothetical protein
LSRAGCAPFGRSPHAYGIILPHREFAFLLDFRKAGKTFARRSPSRAVALAG